MITIGTRGSELALKQAEIAVDKIGLNDSKITVIKTKGDRIKEPLQKAGIGVFTKELDNALLNKEIDIAVHSLKDIPVEGFNDELEIAMVVERGDARDCVVGKIFDGAIIGTDSVRRGYELNSLFKDYKLRFKPLRGNVSTRVGKLENGEYDAIIMAKAGLNRLGLVEKVDKVFSVEEIVPAAGQGAIAIVKRKKDKLDFVRKDKDRLYDSCMLEREFIRDLGGCKKPVGAYCSYDGDGFSLVGVVYRDNKSNSKSKRVVVNFSGNKEAVVEKIRKWKERFI